MSLVRDGNACLQTLHDCVVRRAFSKQRTSAGDAPLAFFAASFARRLSRLDGAGAVPSVSASAGVRGSDGVTEASSAAARALRSAARFAFLPTCGLETSSSSSSSSETVIDASASCAETSATGDPGANGDAGDGVSGRDSSALSMPSSSSSASSSRRSLDSQRELLKPSANLLTACRCLRERS